MKLACEIPPLVAKLVKSENARGIGRASGGSKSTRNRHLCRFDEGRRQLGGCAGLKKYASNYIVVAKVNNIDPKKMASKLIKRRNEKKRP